MISCIARSDVNLGSSTDISIFREEQLCNIILVIRTRYLSRVDCSSKWMEGRLYADFPTHYWNPSKGVWSTAAQPKKKKKKKSGECYVRKQVNSCSAAPVRKDAIVQAVTLRPQPFYCRDILRLS